MSKKLVLKTRDSHAAGFLNAAVRKVTGLSKFEHFVELTHLVWPWLEWNEWLDREIDSLCNEEGLHATSRSSKKFVSWTGCGAGGKTFAAGLWATTWWMASPHNSTAILVSTTKDMIRRRVWPVVQRLYHEAHDPKGNHIEIGHLIDSQTRLQYMQPGRKRGDDKNSIFALAVKSGETQEAIQNLKGVHNERICLVIDEAPGVPEAIFATIPNMSKACNEFVLLVVGNAGDMRDPHGRCCEPLGGWRSVDVSEERWPTKGVKDWHIEPGICHHFDGWKSPNVVAGKTLFGYIYTFEDYVKSKDKEGTLAFWANDRGFWPPEGTSNTVFNDTMIEKYDGTGNFTFMHMRIPCASLDPAFGGDNCVLQRGSLGDLQDGSRGLQLEEKSYIRFDPNSPDEADYQIARQVISKCKEWGVEPRWFGMDTSGPGRGVAAIIAQEWSTQIHRLEFGGAASDLPASTDDPRPSKEVYANRVTELWFSAREFLLSEQLKGLYHEAIVEFTARRYDLKSKRYVIEPKTSDGKGNKGLKARLGRSPDHADAIVVLVDVARRNGMVPKSAKKLSDRTRDSFLAMRKESDEVLENAYVEAHELMEFAEI